MNKKIVVSIVGGSGYAGGELLRILLGHPLVEIKHITSERLAGMPVTVTHPNLRSLTQLTYTKAEDLDDCDILFVGLPNGVSMGMMKNFMKVTRHIIDLGADFRLDSETDWTTWYKKSHEAPEYIQQFVYGIPEINRDAVAGASYIAGPGCEAMVSTLTLYPFVKHKLIESTPIIIDAKMGSSQAGATASSSSHHPERSGSTRSYKPTGHRHAAEIETVLRKIRPDLKVDISATAIEMVRGILVTIHAFLRTGVTEKDVWKAVRAEYGNQPFMRVVKEKTGLYRFPEPKILQGTNFCDIGWELEPRGNRIVLLGAIDNLVKGTSGNAVQCMNIMCGYPERTGLEFPGLHPI